MDQVSFTVTVTGSCSFRRSPGTTIVLKYIDLRLRRWNRCKRSESERVTSADTCCAQCRLTVSEMKTTYCQERTAIIQPVTNVWIFTEQSETHRPKTNPTFSQHCLLRRTESHSVGNTVKRNRKSLLL